MRLLITHESHYDYATPSALGPHLVRLRPAQHTRATIETYGLHIGPQGHLRWQQDPFGNHLARVTFPAGTRAARLSISVELAVDIHPVNPFDFFVDDRAKNAPFTYPDALRAELAPFLDASDPCYHVGDLAGAFFEELPRAGDTVALLSELNRAVNARVRYVIREEAGIYTPEETLAAGRGSCRDSSVLLIAALRSRGFAARFASGYLVQLVDEGMIPDEPKGVDRDVVDLHAWAEVFLPGAGWIGLDPTSGLLCGEGHIPLACVSRPELAAPIEGTAEHAAEHAHFRMTVARLGHEVRPTAPYLEETWTALLDASDVVDAALTEEGLQLTSGGEPTLTSREHLSAPEWNGEALGPTKWTHGQQLARALKNAHDRGAAVLLRQGKHYPGESLPRWALELLWREEAQPLWTGESLPEAAPTATLEHARVLAHAIATRVGMDPALVQTAFEDPWRHLQDEAALPVDVDPHAADLDAPEERRRLARVLERGLATPAGFVLPLLCRDGHFISERWQLRRERLYAVPGDSPLGLRLPLRSLGEATPPTPRDATRDVVPRDPRLAEDDAAAQPHLLAADAADDLASRRAPHTGAVRTALCVEPRANVLHVFLPPTESAADFITLVEAVDGARAELGLEVQLEGYAPPADPALKRLSITPDPGVLEVNIPPSRSGREHAARLLTVFDAGLRAGLHGQKYLLDGRLAGSGGGHHITVGGPSPFESPFVQRPDLLASLITFAQHHPCLSYLFAGLFVGPTSQAPRVDETRHEALSELELALPEAFRFAPRRGEKRWADGNAAQGAALIAHLGESARALASAPPPWLGDLLFRHMLVDLTGNTHRAELCVDKLWSPAGAHGRQGLVELRAFEMPPHPRLAAAQVLLVRALVAALARKPYEAPLVRWGERLHDQFFLPYWLWRDCEEVLAYLAAAGVPLPAEAFSPFVELRCPLVGVMQAGPVTVELRNALEAWNVLGEELTQSGTARFVDSSMERIEVRARGLVPERHVLLVNGMRLPTHATPQAGERVAGVRFRAWAPPHSLHAHIGIHHPLRIDVLDTWGRRSLGACAYHVWHPEGRAFETPPLTPFEAAARRAQRFTFEAPQRWPVEPLPAMPHAPTPHTLDLRRAPLDRAPPAEPAEDAATADAPRERTQSPAYALRRRLTP